MKKLLLAISFIMLVANLRAQEAATDQTQVGTKYDFNAAADFYLEGNALWKYPQGGYSRIFYDVGTKEYISAEEFIEKYGELSLNTLVRLEKLLEPVRKSYREKTAHSNTTQLANHFRWRLHAATTVVGGALIGASFAAFAVNAYANNDIDSQKTIGYVCAGVSVVGAICILAGLHKEYYTVDGLKLANGLSVSDAGGGISITKRF